MKRFLVVLIFAFVLTGCATPNVATDFDPNKLTKTGVVVGSITYKGIYGAYRVYLQSSADKKNYIIEHGSLTTLNPMLAFKGEDIDPLLGKRGSFFAIELPTGEYQIVGWNISVGYFHVSSTNPTGLTFKVESQKPVYLGNFDFLVTRTFMRNPTQAEVKLSDNRANDLAASKEKFPKLAAMPWDMAFPDRPVVERLGGGSKGSSEVPFFVVPTRK